MTQAHSFHIPVMGIAYTVDTPLKVAPFGIDSVISLLDDSLLEKLRKLYSNLHGASYQEITPAEEDYRAKRITSYLNLVQQIIQAKVEDLKLSAAEMSREIKKYFQMLPDSSPDKKTYQALTALPGDPAGIKNQIGNMIKPGNIDVNIMTRVDRENFSGKEKLSYEFNDAHAALRGFANSELSSSVVFSAGMNPRLYSYIAQFDDFFPDSNGNLKKKITLKVSDFRSAMIQGKFLASKGLWVSEYRIESGLNCGGHAFATDGNLLGPVLHEFRDQRAQLTSMLNEILRKALYAQKRPLPTSPLQLRLSVQGGVGTASEHQFLSDHYGMDSVGWGSPFLLVPEAVNVDTDTLELLKNASEKDLYLSNISPLGIPFNSVHGNTKDIEKEKRIEEGKPGSRCPKRYAALDKEFSSRGLCKASRLYQILKIRQLDQENLPAEEHKKAYTSIVEKSCICVGLGTPALLVNNLNTRVEGESVSVCPGPNMAYFSEQMGLSDIVDHIYGRKDFMKRRDRPHMFMKELSLYLDHLQTKMNEFWPSAEGRKNKSIDSFMNNLRNGIDYYYDLFSELKSDFGEYYDEILNHLDQSTRQLDQLNVQLITVR